jgi:Kef-type K+ transport system membrane component KefB
MSATDLTARFFLAVAIILVVCKLVSLLVARAGQAPVIGEMVAGVLLGPSLLGEISPRLEAALFPAALLPVINVAGQLGVAALMFQAGRELRNYLAPRLGRTAATISGVGVAVPLAAGIGLTLMAERHVPIVMPGVSAAVTAAFVGVTLAITAFPVLARIIVERGLSGTRFASVALACGGIDDVAAWVLLAGVLSLASARSWLFTKAVVGAIVFVAILVLVVRPALKRYLGRPGLSPQTVLLVTIVLVLVAAWFTTYIGLHAVFGAFSVGLVMPREPEAALTSEDRDLVTSTIDGLSWLLVPMFFTYSGLNTRFALLANTRVLFFSAAAIAVAILSKGGACWFGARLAGERPPVAKRIGALMNARGLTQLIALNVGLQAGIAGQDLFTSLVLVALVTTIMTAPVLTWIDRREAGPITSPGGGRGATRSAPTASRAGTRLLRG